MKPKRRRQTKPRLAATPRLMLSDRLLASAATLVAGKNPGPDARVIELFLAWCGNRVLQDGLLDQARCLAERALSDGRDEDACPALRRAEAMLSEAQRALLQELAAAPAESQRGLALKLLLWRWESCHRRDGALEDVHEFAAFAAYRDGLALAGIETLAHPRDKLTCALLRAGKALEGEDD
jgi:hypothetical protein